MFHMIGICFQTVICVDIFGKSHVYNIHLIYLCNNLLLKKISLHFRRSLCTFTQLSYTIQPNYEVCKIAYSWQLDFVFIQVIANVNHGSGFELTQDSFQLSSLVSNFVYCKKSDHNIKPVYTLFDMFDFSINCCWSGNCWPIYMIPAMFLDLLTQLSV